MRKLILIISAIAVFTANRAYAERSREIPPGLLTTGEAYEDCKAAIALADAGKQEAFMRSYCGVSLSSFFAGYDLALLRVHPVPIEGDKCHAKMQDNVKDAASICIDPSLTPYEHFYSMVRIYIRYVEENLRSGSEKEFLEYPALTTMSLATVNACRFQEMEQDN
jgi:hypothetical protein